MFFYDINGKKVFEQNTLINEGINYKEISIEKFQPGIYVARIDNVSKMIVINK
jgi:hypothetical protein